MTAAYRIHLPLLAVLYAIAVWFGWVGYMAADDASYAQAALAWLNDPPHVGTTHWSLRHPLVLSAAAAISMLGFGEAAVVLPNLVHFAGLILITYAWLARAAGSGAALTAAALVTVTPLFAVNASVLEADMVELFYMVLSFWLFWEVAERRLSPVWLLVSGIAAGVGLLTRENAGLIMIVYFVLVLGGWRLPRAAYVMLGLAFLAVFAGEMLFYQLTVGDPLHRLHVDISHGDIGGGIDRVTHRGFGELSREGNIQIGPLVDPFLVVFANQEFGLLFLVGIPLSIWLMRATSATDETRRLIRILVLMALVGFVTVASAYMILNLLPRYFALATYAMAILVGLAIHRLLQDGHLRLGAGMLATMVAVNALCIHIENRTPVQSERQLADLLAATKEPLHTDPETANRLKLLMVWRGVPPERLRPDPPGEGALYFFNPNRVERYAAKLSKRFDLAPYRPRSEWEVVWRAPDDVRLVGRMLEAVGIAPLLPSEIGRRLARPVDPATLYRVHKQ